MKPHPRLAAWVAAGLTDAHIARRVGVDPRTVMRWRHAAHLARPRRDAQEAPHGTLTRYRAGCACQDCRAANTAAQARYRARRAASTRLAPNHGAPWSPDDDAELLTGAGDLVERAVRLGRTYDAARCRLIALRRRTPP